jgi:hypothetical protein
VGTLPDPGIEAGDVDMFAFTVAAGQRVTFDVDLLADRAGMTFALSVTRDEARPVVCRIMINTMI